MTPDGVTARQAQRLAAVDWRELGRALVEVGRALADAFAAGMRSLVAGLERVGLIAAYAPPTYWCRTTAGGTLGPRRAYRGCKQVSKQDQRCLVWAT